jgi:hypothetical protein
MPLRPDDDMVMHLDLEMFRSLDQVAGQVDVLPARRRIAARMVVDDDDRGGVEIERAAQHFADMDRRFATELA